MSASPAIVKVRCHYCSIYRLPGDMINYPGGVKRCLQCEEHHQAALRSLGGKTPPPDCMVCGVSFVVLSEKSPDGDTPVWLVWKDGILQALCSPCHAAYVPKRLDLYGDTQYGHRKKLKGAK